MEIKSFSGDDVYITLCTYSDHAKKFRFTLFQSLRHNVFEVMLSITSSQKREDGEGKERGDCGGLIMGRLI